MQKLLQIIRETEDILSTRPAHSRKGLSASLDELDARQRYYIRRTLERARLIDQALVVRLVILRYLVDHWFDQDLATKVTVLWCIDSLPGTQFTRVVLRRSPYVSEILDAIHERLGGDNPDEHNDANQSGEGVGVRESGADPCALVSSGGETIQQATSESSSS